MTTSLSTFSQNAIKIIEGEPRMRDTDLGAVLGMAQPLNIRSKIAENIEELKMYGTIHAARESFTSGKPIALVARGVRQRKSGRFSPLTVRKASKTRGEYVSLTGAATAIMFTLVPLARIKKRLHAEQVFRAAVRRLPGLILKYRRELLRA